MSLMQTQPSYHELYLKGQIVDQPIKTLNRYRKLKKESGKIQDKKQVLLQIMKNKEFIQEKGNVLSINKCSQTPIHYFESLPIRIVSKSQYHQILKPEIMEAIEDNTENMFIEEKQRVRFEKPKKSSRSSFTNSQNTIQKKKCGCGKCQECFKNFTLYLKIFEQDENLPPVSAKSWCVWRKQKGIFRFVYGKRPYKQREIASLTKILVAIVVSQKIKKWNLNPSRIFYQIPKYCKDICGTSANLKVGTIMNITDLLYGMMLPSGNDAAIVLSQIFGLGIFLQYRKRLKTFDFYDFESFKEYEHKTYIYYFVSAMNQKCRELGLMNTVFFNPHGNDAFEQNKNVSNPHELGKICFEILDDDFLTKIINTKSYKEWNNTNKLLWEGFQGIKTGITQTAGPCLAALYKDILIVVLNCRSVEERWIQVKKLVKWVKNR